MDIVPDTETTVPGHAGQFVGRDSDLQRLQATFDTASAGEGALVMLAGEPGIGKTRLVQEFAAIAGRQGARLLWGRCHEGEWTPPFGPWADALGEYVRGSDPDELRAACGAAAPVLARLIPDLRELLPGLPEAAPLGAEEERFRLYDAVSQFLRRSACDRPVVLVLDDLQWADQDSLSMLHHVARAAAQARLMIVGAYRDGDLDRRHPLSGVLAMLRRDAGYLRISLKGLSESDVSVYLDGAAEQPLPEDLARAIHAETDGNPFFVREIVLHLLEEGRLSGARDEQAPGISIGEWGIPEGVRQVVGRRLSRLSAETNRVLSLAAAFSGGFSFRVLQMLSDLPEEVLLDCIDDALGAQLIRPVEGRAGLELYEFSHAIIRDTLYDEMSPSRRMRLHRRVADALTRVHAGHERDHAAEIAAQYYASATLPEAEGGIPFALAAAEQARAASAHERVVTFLRIARELAIDAPLGRQAGILSRLAVAEAEALMLDDGRQTADAAFEAHVGDGSASDTIAAFLADAARALKDGGARPALWEPLVERAFALIGDSDDLTWARLQLLRDPIEPICSGIIEAGRWLGFDPRAVAIAREQGDEDDYAHTLEPFDRRSRADTEAVHTLVGTWQRPTAILRGLNVVARELLYRHGAFHEAVERCQELLAAGERFGSIPQQAEALVHLISAYAAVGELQRAREAQDRAQELVGRLGRAHRLHVVQSFLAYYYDGDWPVIAEVRARTLTDPDLARIPIQLPAAAWAARAYAQAGMTAAARDILEALTPVLEQMDPRMWVHNGAVSLAAAAVWELPAADLAPRYLRLAHDLVESGAGSFPIVSNELTLARMAALSGGMVEAIGHFAGARARLDAGGQQPERAIACYDEALALIRSDEPDHGRALSLLDDALTTFRALGMEGWVVRALRQQELLFGQPARHGHGSSSDPAGLSDREREVLCLLAGGRTNKEIADALVLSVSTVERHIMNLYRKIGARGRADATAYAIRTGLVTSA
jgi:DNA-binding CsgD family transcriptional regulator/tetratricopeptide (TPR) repeat protein